MRFELPASEIITLLGGHEQVSHRDVKALWDSLSEQEREMVLKILEEERSEPLGSTTYRAMTQRTWRVEPVSPEVFLTDPNYLGHVGQYLYPLLLDRLCRILDNTMIREVICTGAIGWGKSFVVSIAICYELYLLLCMNEPMRLFGNKPGTPIILTALGITARNVTNVMHGYITDHISESPWFQNVCTPIRGHLEWPNVNNISFRGGSSSENSIIGENVIGGVMDEANFMINARQSRRAKMAGEFDQAKVLYDALERRRTSRFTLSDGSVLAKFWLVSSKQFPGDFLEQRIRKAEKDPTVAVLDYPMWVPKMSSDRHQFGKSYFFLFIGNSSHKSHIIGSAEEWEYKIDTFEIPAGCRVQKVPKLLERFYIEDLHGSIRDISGHAILAKNPFIQDPKWYRECVALEHLRDISRQHPFTEDEPSRVSLQDIVPSKFLTILLNEDGDEFDYSKREHVVHRENFKPYPAINPHRARYVHVDLGRTNDGAAFGVGHFGGYETLITHEVVQGEVVRFLVERPIVIVDVMCRFYAPTGGVIEPAKVREVIKACLSFGCYYNVDKVTYDGFQSAESIDTWNAWGISSYTHSVDRTDRAYTLLRQGYIERRISSYHYEPLFQDLSSLQIDAKSGKIDHTGARDDGRPGTKDVADCIAAITEHIENQYATRRTPLPHTLGEFDTERVDIRQLQKEFGSKTMMDPDGTEQFDRLRRQVDDYFDENN